MDNFEEPQQFVNNPLSEHEMQTKLAEIRQSVGSKVDKWANRIQVSMAFTPQVKRLEGEVWEEKGKKWTVKDGVRQNVTILDNARMPWWCPKCSKPMNHRFDKKFYYRKGMCFNCTVDWEGSLRVNGTYEEYEKRIVRENEKSFLRDKIQEKLEYIRNFTVPQMHYSDGRWEELASITMFEGLFKSLEQDVEFMLQRLEAMAREETGEENGALGTDQNSSEQSVDNRPE